MRTAIKRVYIYAHLAVTTEKHMEPLIVKDLATTKLLCKVRKLALSAVSNKQIALACELVGWKVEQKLVGVALERPMENLIPELKGFNARTAFSFDGKESHAIAGVLEIETNPDSEYNKTTLADLQKAHAALVAIEGEPKKLKAGQLYTLNVGAIVEEKGSYGTSHTVQFSIFKVIKAHVVTTEDGKTYALHSNAPSYEFASWAKDTNLSDLLSAKLDLPPVAVETEIRESKKRDLTNTGTCGCCEGNFKRNDAGGLVLHGFSRPWGWGVTVGSCFGVGYQPHELSSDCAKDYIKKVIKPTIATMEQRIADLNAGTATVYYTVREQGQRKQVAVKPGEAKYADLVEDNKRETSYHLSRAKDTLVRFEKKVANWKLDTLPEQKWNELVAKWGKRIAG